MLCPCVWCFQGPPSNFEIGGASLVTQYWGGTRYFFLLALYNFKNIGRGGGVGGSTCPPPYSAVPGFIDVFQPVRYVWCRFRKRECASSSIRNKQFTGIIVPSASLSSPIRWCKVIQSHLPKQFCNPVG